MTIKEYYANYKETKKLGIALPVGMAVSVEEFYNNCITINSLPLDNVLAWHKMFMDYVKREDAIFWVRYYESGDKKSGRWNTRRGSKTKFEDGFSYVFVSNFDAHEIFNMVRLGVIPDVDEFLDMMKSYEFSLHYESGNSCEECEIAEFPRVGSTRGGILTPDHWYLAHIVGIKSNFYDADGNVISIDTNKLFPRGELSDWKIDEIGKKVRKLDYTLSDSEKNVIKAHFLRFVDPINYYAAPGKNYQSNDVSAIIGEAKVLNDYMGAKFASVYGMAIMEEFRKAALAKLDLIADKNAVINVEYGIRVGTSERTSKRVAVPREKKRGPNVDVSDYNGRKIADIVKTDLKELLESGSLSNEEIDNLQTKEYSKKHFDINYPLLVLEGMPREKERYYSFKTLFVEIKGKRYFMCNQWFENESNNDRPYLIKYIKDHK